MKIQFKPGEEDVFAIAKPIIGFDTGHYLGTVVLYMKEKDLALMYLDNIINQNDKFYIIDENKRIISTQDKRELYQAFDENKYLGDYRLEEISDDQSIIRGIDSIQTLITVRDFGKLNWKIVSLTPLDEITYENKNITRLIVVFDHSACFLPLRLHIYFPTDSKPILKLVKIMKEIQSGNMKLRANLRQKTRLECSGQGLTTLWIK